MPITIISILFLLIYTLLILFFWEGWRRIPVFITEENKESYPLVSVIVCAKDEEKNILSLLTALDGQSYHHFELILVNDHSTDDTVNIAHSVTLNEAEFRIINAAERGKKNALREGIAASRGEIIVQTDADCIPQERWLQSIVGFYVKQKPDLIIGPVRIDASTAFGEMQALEFLSLVASGAGAAGMDKPIMCNGANLAYKRSLWREAADMQHLEYASGDDMFLLQAALKLKKKIMFLKSPDAIIPTRAAETVNAFFRQRRRWASKSGGYRDAFLIFTALIVLGVSLWFLVLLIIGHFKVLICVFLWKFLIDYLFLSATAPFFNLKKSLKWTIPVALCYPFYILWSSAGSVFYKRKW